MRATALLAFCLIVNPSRGQEPASAPSSRDAPAAKSLSELVKPSTFAALKVRSIGPALLSGRIGDLAVNPRDHSEYYVGVASGGVWKTTNNGTTYEPVFDDEGSYSIGCLAIDPRNPKVVWVGTGENNSQRSVSFGDGVYKSVDGGKSWKNMGLAESEHIGMIAIHPDDTATVYVAAQGPLWRPGGDRGLYKTTDGGKTWDQVLYISVDTGINEVHLDPRDPDTLYATAYQRRRRVWTMIDGGPESGVYKSEDGGQTWRELEQGLPSGDKGKIGLDLSPANPDVIYAIVEAKDEESGLFRSLDRGESWEKRNDSSSSAPMYYNEIVCDPHDADRLYNLDTFLEVTTDGGKSFTRVQGQRRHVDNHALWIDPDNSKHLIVGCDGGVYESWDQALHWQYKANLPITQFYRVSVDNSSPFYYVYGGTQDNNTLGGPARTTRRSISNEDWFVTVGGDGFETQVDPEDPNIVYSQWQYGGLVRHDRRNGENVDIKPRPKPGDPPHVFNWDAPLLISPHSHTRLYFGGRRLYRSDDRGNSWSVVSNDLSRGIDRNQLEVMGRVQPVDAIAKHRSTSIYGNIVALSESPLVENLLYVGTDDGLIHVTEDGGDHWRKIDAFPGVPHMTYVSCLTASRHQKDTVFAAFDNHKNGDFKPYLLRSDDRGGAWTSVIGDLGEREIVYSIVEDHVRVELLFCGTEFGAHFTLNGGKNWLEIAGLPTISVRDIDIQRRENDLAMATFGRGFYVLDDYSPLQRVTADDLERPAHVFPIKAAWFYIPSRRGRGSQGDSYWTASNPPFGAVFTYHLKEEIEAGPKIDEKAESPDYEKLRKKERTPKAGTILTIQNDRGEVVRRLAGKTGKGVHRTSWDLRYGGAVDRGPHVLPGRYTMTLSQQVQGEITQMTEPEPFEVLSLALGRFQPEEPAEVRDFHHKIAKLYLAVQATGRSLDEAEGQLAGVAEATFNSPRADPGLAQEAHDLLVRLKNLREALDGDPLPRRFEEPSLPGVRQRVGFAAASWNMTAPPTQTQRDAYEYAADEFRKILQESSDLMEIDLRKFQKRLDEAGVTWTRGRLPVWEKE